MKKYQRPHRQSRQRPLRGKKPRKPLRSQDGRRRRKVRAGFNLSLPEVLEARRVLAALTIPEGKDYYPPSMISSDVINNGSFFCKQGSEISVLGDFTQTQTGKLFVDLGTSVTSTGSAHLAGALSLTLADNTGPLTLLKVGDRLPLLRFESLQGRFDSVSGLNILGRPDLYLSVDYIFSTASENPLAAPTDVTGIDLVVMQTPIQFNADGSTSSFHPSADAQGLFLITHGYTSNVTEAGNDFAAIAAAVAKQTPGWDVVAVDWAGQAASGLGHLSPWSVAENGYEAGESLADWMLECGYSYTNYHLAAHSAGTWLVSAFADALPTEKHVEATIFDGFTPATTRIAGTTYAQAGTRFDGGVAIYVEDILDRTADYWPNLINVDVSYQRKHADSWFPTLDELLNPAYALESHAYPYEWYRRSLTTTPGAPGWLPGMSEYGFSISLASRTPEHRDWLETRRGKTVLLEFSDFPVVLQDRPEGKPVAGLPDASKYGQATTARVLLNSAADQIAPDETAIEETSRGFNSINFLRDLGGPAVQEDLDQMWRVPASTDPPPGGITTLGLPDGPLSLTALEAMGFEIELEATASAIYAWLFQGEPSPTSLATISFERLLGPNTRNSSSDDSVTIPFAGSDFPLGIGGSAAVTSNAAAREASFR